MRILAFGPECSRVSKRPLVCLAIPGTIVEVILESHRNGLFDVAGVRRVDFGRLDFALSKTASGIPLTTVRTLPMLGEAQAAREEVRGYGPGERGDDQPLAPGERARPHLLSARRGAA